MAHQRGFEPLTARFVAEYSIQLSYWCGSMRGHYSPFPGLSQKIFMGLVFLAMLCFSHGAAAAQDGPETEPEADRYAGYEAGIEAALGGDYATAFREFSIAASQGLDLAQYNLAILYYTGRGVDRDLALSYRWTRAAAEQGHAAAQANLGSLYLAGEGVAQDVAGGIEWLKRAARGGESAAAFSLATFYHDGDLVPQDRVQAHAWAAWAEHRGHPDAAALRQRMEARLSPAQLSTARRLFARWQIGDF